MSPVAQAVAPAKDPGSPALRHIPALDGVRGVAILLVLIGHFFTYETVAKTRVFTLLSSIGGTGVDLFFVLSGFLITRILLSTRESPAFLTNFYARRILRIFPLYYGYLFVLYAILPLLGLAQTPPARVQIWTWTYLQNVSMTFFPSRSQSLVEWTPHLWSLAVEEHFYLVWPFIVKFVDRRRLPWILACMIPFAVLSRWLVLSAGYGPAYLTPCRVDALGLGSLLAVIAGNEGEFKRWGRLLRRALLVLVPVAFAGVFIFSGRGLPVVQLFKDTGTALLYTGVVMAVLQARRGGLIDSILSHRSIMTVGKYSYGMYVFHLTIFGSLGAVVAGIWAPLRFLALAGAVFLLAATSWQFYEQPFLKLKKRFA